MYQLVIDHGIMYSTYVVTGIVSVILAGYETIIALITIISNVHHVWYFIFVYLVVSVVTFFPIKGPSNWCRPWTLLELTKKVFLIGIIMSSLITQKFYTVSWKLSTAVQIVRILSIRNNLVLLFQIVTFFMPIKRNLSTYKNAFCSVHWQIYRVCVFCITENLMYLTQKTYPMSNVTGLNSHLMKNISDLEYQRCNDISTRLKLILFLIAVHYML